MAKHVETEPEKMLGHIQIDSDIVFPWSDRFRILFGCKVAVRTQLHTRWRVSEFTAANIMLVEQFFSGWKFRIRTFFRGLSEKLSKPQS